jgi:hypothetical protein
VLKVTILGVAAAERSASCIVCIAADATNTLSRSDEHSKRIHQMRRRNLLIGTLATTLVRPVDAEATSVVLELFTSQGCSSCPPADALLGKLADGQGVIALAWHVDYWNSVFWHDPYASAFATKRQRGYADQLGDELYTPAMVVNGSQMVVGSDSAAILKAISTAGAFTVGLALRDGVAEIGAANEPVSALLVIYDPQETTQVGGGENSGRRLTEYHVVREATVLGSWDGTPQRLMLPAVAPGRGAVLLVQSADLRVRGAARVSTA